MNGGGKRQKVLNTHVALFDESPVHYIVAYLPITSLQGGEIVTF